MNPKDALEQYEATEAKDIVRLLKTLSSPPVECAPLSFKAQVLARLDAKRVQQKIRATVVAFDSNMDSNPRKEAQPYFETIFLAMAAADRTSTIAGERKDQSGEWTLRIFSDRDNPDEGYVLLEVCKERAAEFEGKVVTLMIGAQTVFSGEIHQGEAAKEVTLEGLQPDASWNIQIE